MHAEGVSGAGSPGTKRPSVRGPVGKENKGVGLERSARRFEAMVVETMVREMWKTIPVSQEEGRSPGFSLAQDLYQRELSKELVGAGGFGLARQIVDDARKGEGMPELPAQSPVRPSVLSVTV